MAGREIVFDDEGFFGDANDWTEEVFEILVHESGLKEITKTHWMVVRFLRDYYFNYGRAPLNRKLKEATGMSLMELEGLFPGGLKYGARRLAGLPNPKTCA